HEGTSLRGALRALDGSPAAAGRKEFARPGCIPGVVGRSVLSSRPPAPGPVRGLGAWREGGTAVPCFRGPRGPHVARGQHGRESMVARPPTRRSGPTCFRGGPSSHGVPPGWAAKAWHRRRRTAGLLRARGRRLLIARGLPIRPWARPSPRTAV